MDNKINDTDRLNQYLLKVKEMYCNLIAIGNIERKDLSEFSGQSYVWNVNLKELRQVFSSKFGNNLNEYQGINRNVFFNLDIAMTYLFNLWQVYQRRIMRMDDGRDTDIETWKDEMQNYLNLAEQAFNEENK